MPNFWNISIKQIWTLINFVEFVFAMIVGYMKAFKVKNE